MVVIHHKALFDQALNFRSIQALYEHYLEPDLSNLVLPAANYKNIKMNDNLLLL